MREAANTNFLVICVTWQGLEFTIYRKRGEQYKPLLVHQLLMKLLKISITRTV